MNKKKRSCDKKCRFQCSIPKFKDLFTLKISKKREKKLNYYFKKCFQADYFTNMNF